MKSITFYSYKGGVGRSLALSNMAIRLSELNKSVCVLDFDLEAPGLQYKFGKYNKSRNIESGIVDYISNFKNQGDSSQSIKDYSIELIPHNKYATNIQYIPAGNISDTSYWHKLSLINWSSLFYKEDGLGVRFFLDLKEKIKKELNPDFLFIDSRTGITDIAGITLRLLADKVVILSANNNENKDGTLRIIKSLLNKENELFGVSPDIHFVLTRIPFSKIESNKETRVIEELKKTFKQEFPDESISVSVIHSDRRLEENEQHLIGYEIEEGAVTIENNYLKLFDTICLDSLSNEEVENFKNKKRAEKLYQKCLDAESDSEKMKLISETIALDSSKADYHQQRGELNRKLGNNTEALKDFEKALEINPTMIEVLNSIGNIYFNNLKQYEKALEFFNKAIEIRSSFELLYLNKSLALEKLNRKEEALETLNYLLDFINPDNSVALNDRADFYRAKNDFKAAYKDIYKAISIDNEYAISFATLAEICLEDGKFEEFYLNLGIALSKGITEKEMKGAKMVYQKVKNEERFISLLSKYNLDIDEIFTE